MINSQVKDISKGAYGFVILARDRRTHEEFALKLIERGQKITRSVEREILNHKKLEHPHVISLHGVCRTDDYLILIMEYASGGSLRKYITTHGKLPKEEARRLFQQLLLSVDYCHRMGVSNRDIKPDNILLDKENNVKLCDFGYSKDEDLQSMANTRLGTPAYTAPEIFKLISGQVQQTYDAKAADVWSCGVTLCEMVTGVLPFKRPEDTQLKHAVRSDRMMERLLRGDYAFPPDCALSNDLADLIQGMLNIDPKARMTVKEISRHPWFTVGLPQGAFLINNMLVQESRQAGPSDDEVKAIRSIVREAQRVVMVSPTRTTMTSKPPQMSCDMESFFSGEYR